MRLLCANDNLCSVAIIWARSAFVRSWLFLGSGDDDVVEENPSVFVPKPPGKLLNAATAVRRLLWRAAVERDRWRKEEIMSFDVVV